MKADKLNYPRTVLVGLAFLSICAFWQLYDNIVPLILTGTFRMNETLSGAIMVVDVIKITLDGRNVKFRLGSPPFFRSVSPYSKCFDTLDEQGMVTCKPFDIA